MYEQLNYEAIKEEAGMDDSQLVYVSFSNQALAHLPYMVALDETSRYHFTSHFVYMVWD